MSRKVICAWDGCRATTTTPQQDGWAWYTAIPPDDREGFLCPVHSRVMDDFDTGDDAPQA